MEQWKTLNQCSDYMISDEGRVKSLKHGRERILSPRYSVEGYIQYSISCKGKPKYFRAHRLVAEHFIPNPFNKPTVNHKDGNKANNCVSNLEWATLSEQMQHAYDNNLKKPVRGYLQGNSVLTEEEVLEIRRIYKAHDKQFGMNALAEKYKVSTAVINRVVHYRSYRNVK